MTTSNVFADSRGGSRIAIAFVIAAVLVTGLAFTSKASATIQNYCPLLGVSPPYVVLASGNHCDGPRHTININVAGNYYGNTSFRVCAGIVNSSGNIIGSYACNGGRAEQDIWGVYGVVTPRIHNGDTTQSMWGQSQW